MYYILRAISCVLDTANFSLYTSYVTLFSLSCALLLFTIECFACPTFCFYVISIHHTVYYLLYALLYMLHATYHNRYSMHILPYATTQYQRCTIYDLRSTVLYLTAQYDAKLYYVVLDYSILFYSIIFYTILYYTILYKNTTTVLYYTIL